MENARTQNYGHNRFKQTLDVSSLDCDPELVVLVRYCEVEGQVNLEKSDTLSVEHSLQLK